MKFTTDTAIARRHLYIYGEIGGIGEYKELFSKMDSEWSYGAENVVLHINSPGGSLPTFLALAERLRQVKTLSATVDGECMSAALLLFLLAENRACVPHAMFMAHNVCIVPANMATSIKNMSAYTDIVDNIADKLIKLYLADPNEGFFTEKEIEDLSAGKEIYFDGKSAKERGIINSSVDDVA